MGIFKRSRPDETGRATANDLSTLVLQGEDMIEQLMEAHRTWGLGTADTWGLDQQSGLITWTFPDKVATAPAQILGTWIVSRGSWRWAWANEGILPGLAQAARDIRDWAEENGHSSLAQAELEGDDQLPATNAAISVRVTRATGFYRGGSTGAVPFITFGPVTITPTDGGEPSTFSITVEN